MRVKFDFLGLAIVLNWNEKWKVTFTLRLIYALTKTIDHFEGKWSIF